MPTARARSWRRTSSTCRSTPRPPWLARPCSSAATRTRIASRSNEVPGRCESGGARMISRRALEIVLAGVRQHCEAKGYREGPGVNNFVPHDAVAAFGMARRLIASGFDHFLAIAPEGHIYGYFFER